jgi:hypothetical protein
MFNNQQSRAGYEGTDEYVPAGADPYEIRPDARRVTLDGDGQAQIHVLRWDAESKLFTAKVSLAGKLALRLFNYPAWRVEVNDRVVATGTKEVTGQMLVPVQAGENRVRITFTRTWDRTAGGIVSGTAVAFLMAIAVFQRRRT